jgi:hypothetical protein
MALWIDTNNVLHDDADGAVLLNLSAYPSWPKGMTIATQQQIDAIRNPPKTVAQVQAEFQASAQAALDKVTGPSGTIMRCVVAGIAVPAAWTAYVQGLRAIANGTDKTSTALPTRPTYPSGT